MKSTKLKKTGRYLATVFVWLATTGTALAAQVEKLSPEQELGRLLYQDVNLSLERNQSCASCHSLKRVKPPGQQRLPAPGFVDPANVRTGSPVSGGSIAGKTGSLNTPSAGYAAFSPFFHWDSAEGLYVGGQFWNGRGASLAEQAKGPFLNPLEMAMPNQWAVVSRLKERRKYLRLFQQVYGLDLAAIPDYEGTYFYKKGKNKDKEESSEREAFPPGGVLEIYDRMAMAIAAFEKSRRFNKFNSKFDFYLAGMTQLSSLEARGLALFEGKAQCSACHVSTATTAPDGSAFPPLFTDFTYDNIGLPRNMNIPGQPDPDLGLGGRSDIAARDPAGNELGKHKVMSLRNIELTPPYGHNGVLKTLQEVVHFYNTRDVLGRVTDNTDPGFGITGWPDPEVPNNVNTEELGNLGLSTDEEAALVAFLKTLTDDYPRWGHDPAIPPGTPSAFASSPFPPLP